MASLRIGSFFGLFAGVILSATALPCSAQAPAPPGDSQASELPGTNPSLFGPWEFTLAGRIGVPVGRLKVGEFPTGSAAAGGEAPRALLCSSMAWGLTFPRPSKAD
jgi:hypothetical protein